MFRVRIPAQLLLLSVLSLAVMFFAGARDSVSARHVTPAECGVKSSSFARICRPSAYTSCLGAARRHVKGYSTPFCTQRQTACRSCLSQLRTCISRIGHAPRSEFSCDECSGKFSRCIGRRYPKLKD